MKGKFGFSLVELMVAMALGLFLTGGIITVFIGSKQSFNTQAGLSQLQQSARFSLDIMTQEIRMAGFMGCLSGTTDIENALNGPPPFEVDLSQAIRGYDGKASATWAPALGAVPADVSANLADGTDFIVVIRGANGGVRIASVQPDESGTLKITPNLVPPPFEDDDILVISDCTRSATFQVHNYTNSSGTVNFNTGAGSPGNSTQELGGGSPYEGDASVLKIESRIFFIAQGAGTNNQGNNYNSLWVKVGDNAPVELVPGVEDLQILYGEDTGTDAIPDGFFTADNVSDFLNVFSVKIEVTVSSVDSVGQGGVLRRNFGTPVKLRNRGN